MNGFVDLQINGCFGVDFNASQLSDAEWKSACANLSMTGTREFLPTIITDSIPSMMSKVSRLADFCERKLDDRAIPIGIHVEGPFISPVAGYIGAHPPLHAAYATLDAAKRLVDAGRGWVRMVTLAPEMDTESEITRFLAKQGILVAAGHTNATLDQLKQAVDGGLRLFTHLGNGCPADLPRHDNILHRVMQLRDRLSVTLIADGHHLPTWFLKMLLDWFGDDRSIIVSDAISAAGLPAGFHTLGNRRVWVGEDGVPRSEDRSHFVGSGATLDKMLAIVQGALGAQERVLQKIFAENATRLLVEARQGI